MTKSTIVNARFAAKIYNFISKEETRYYLKGIHIAPHPHGGAVIVATDGHTLGAIHDLNGVCEESVIVSLDANTLKACRNKKGREPLLFVCADEKSPNKGVAAVYNALRYVDGQGKKQDHVPASFWPAPAECDVLQGGALINGTFPDWSRVIPQVSEEDAKPERVAFNPAYMSKFAKVSDSRTPKIALIQPNSSSSAPMIVRVDGVPEFIGVLMPARDAGPTRDRPEWLDKWGPLPETEKQAAE